MKYILTSICIVGTLSCLYNITTAQSLGWQAFWIVLTTINGYGVFAWATR